MSIAEFREKCKYYGSKYLGEEVFIVALILLVGTAGFGLGRLSLVHETRVPAAVSFEDLSVRAAESGTLDAPLSGAYVASKNSDKYHLPWCSGAARISEENKVWFASKEEAEAAGYTPAGNCKGI